MTLVLAARVSTAKTLILLAPLSIAPHQDGAVGFATTTKCFGHLLVCYESAVS